MPDPSSSVSEGRLPLVGFFGGTFDPVHNGHLRMAIEVKERLSFDSMFMVPSAEPPLKGQTTEANHRLSMLEQALRSSDSLRIDAREFRRHGRSYTVDTLAELREELGARVSLVWCVGTDTLATLPSWHQWRQLTDHAHLLIMARPGWSLPEKGEVAEWIQERYTDLEGLSMKPSGGVAAVELTQLEISSSAIRRMITEGYSAEFLVPGSVWHYIKAKCLYGYPESKYPV